MRRSQAKRRSNQRRSSGRRFRPSFERLEDRSMLTIVFNPFFGPETQIQNFNAVLPNPPVYLVFWGSYWKQGDGVVKALQLSAAAQKVIGSTFLQATAQYGTGGTATYKYSITPDLSPEPSNGFGNVQLYFIDYALAHSGQLPNGDESGGNTPIFVIITPPGITSDTANAAGFNTNLNGVVDSVDYPTIWASSGNLNGTAPPDGSVNPDAFSKILSHELAEIMTDLGEGGFRVNPGPNWIDNGDTGHQIGDLEANGYQYREPNGAVVQPVWSRDDNKFIVTDGNTQNFVLSTQFAGYAGNAPYQTYDLILNGDQPGHTDDTFYIDTVSTPIGDEVKVVLNGEIAMFGPVIVKEGTVHPIRSIIINAGSGSNTVYVARTSVPVTIYPNNGDTIKLGVNGSVQGITSDVTTVSNGVTNIEIDDSADTTAREPVIVAGAIANLLPSGAHIYFPDSNQVNWTLDTGPGASVVDVLDTMVGGTLTVNTVQGTNSVNVDNVNFGGPLVVNLGGGTQMVNISPGDQDSSGSVFADVTVHPGTGVSALNIDDEHTANPHHWTINDGSINCNVASAGTIHYGRLNMVTLNGGNNGNTFTVQNTTNGLITNIETNLDDVVDVLGTGPGSTVNIDGYASFVNIGNAGLTASVHGVVYVNTIRTAMVVDDSADLTGQNNVVISLTSITGLSDGVIGYNDGAVRTTSIIGSHGGSTYHVLGVPYTTTTTLTCRGTDTVLVGDNGSLNAVKGNLVIHNPSKFTNLTIDASADNLLGGSDATITNSYVSGLAYGEIDFDQSGLSALTIDGVRGGDPHYPDYVVLGLPSNSQFPIATTLNLFAGDTVYLGRNYSLQGDWGNGKLACDFSGSGPAAHVVLDGSHDSAGATYTIGGNNNLTVVNATVGLYLTVNGFRGQDQVLIDLQAGTVNADLTQTSPGTISLDGTVRLEGTNPAGRVNITVHARDRATASPIAANESMIQAFNTLYLIGTRPQDSLNVFGGDNKLSISNEPIQAPYVQFAAAQGDPASVAAGVPFDFAVVAQNAQGGTVATYASQVQWYAYNRTTLHYFESDYGSFPAADQGQHLFHGIVLPEAGTYALGFDDGWNASSFTITVLATPQGGLNGESDGSSATPNIAAATSAAEPSAATSDAAAGTPSGDVAAAIGSDVSGSSADVALDGSSVESPFKQAPPVEMVPPHITPPNSKQEVVRSSAIDAHSAGLGMLPPSEHMVGVGADYRRTVREATSSDPLRPSGRQPLHQTTSLRINALDEHFAHYDRHLLRHSSNPSDADPRDSWDGDLDHGLLSSTFSN